MSASLPAETEDRHSRTLQRLAALTLELAEDVQARALAAETATEAAALANAFQKVSRGLRQTLALELRVIGFRQEQARQAPDYEARHRRAREAAEADLAAREDQAMDVRAHVESAIWTEREAREEDEGIELQVRLRRWLDLAQDGPDFLIADARKIAEEACRALGLDPALIEDDDEDDEAFEDDDDAPLLAPRRNGGDPRPDSS